MALKSYQQAGMHSEVLQDLPVVSIIVWFIQIQTRPQTTLQDTST